MSKKRNYDGDVVDHDENQKKMKLVIRNNIISDPGDQFKNYKALISNMQLNDTMIIGYSQLFIGKINE